MSDARHQMDGHSSTDHSGEDATIQDTAVLAEILGQGK